MTGVKRSLMKDREPTGAVAPGQRRQTLIRLVEVALYASGTLCLLVWLGFRVTATVGARAELSRFADDAATARTLTASAPDLQLWSPDRIRAWRDTLLKPGPPPLGILRATRLGLEVAVLEGTDDWTLNRAVGHIEDTPAPGDEGNSGIAGHRDGFFRCLKDIRVGDALELETREGRERYTVQRVWIVGPEDVSVLDPTPQPSLTLVTCYPFYYIGSAPQRFIVRAVRTNRNSSARPT